MSKPDPKTVELYQLFTGMLHFFLPNSYIFVDLFPGQEHFGIEFAERTHREINAYDYIHLSYINGEGWKLQDSTHIKGWDHNLLPSWFKKERWLNAEHEMYSAILAYARATNISTHNWPHYNSAFSDSFN